MTDKVKAAVIAEPGKVETSYFPYPKLEEGAMLMKMEMSGICGTDKHSYKGETHLYAGTQREQFTSYPLIPGHENVGTVAEITEEARQRLEFYGQELKEGDRVVMCCDIMCGNCYECRNTFGFTWCNNFKTYGVNMSCEDPPHLFGGWAEYMYITPDVFVYKVPDDMPPEVALLTEPMACTYSLDKAKDFSAMPSEGFCSSDTVLIQGVGPIGLCHLVKAQILGAGEVIAIDRSEFRLDMATEFGADHVINAAETTAEERISLVRDLTHGRGPDVVVDCVGLPDVFIEGLEMLSNGGVFIEEGAFVETGTAPVSPHRHLLAKNARLLGMVNHAFTGYYPSMKLMQRFGKYFPFEKIVTHRFKIEDAKAALLRSMELDSMKVVITP